MKSLLIVLTVLFLCGNASAESIDLGITKDEAKKETIDRCKGQMSTYGALMVKACVDQDLEAFKEIVEYSEEHQSILDRCMKQMRSFGFSMVQACADQDIQAEKELSEY